MKFKTLAIIATIAAPFAAQAQSLSPWLPIPGQVSLSAGYSSQTADNAYIGDQSIAIRNITGGAATVYKRNTTAVRVDYGFSDAVAFDGTLTSVKTSAGAADSDSGGGDSVVGLRWRVLDEYEGSGAPTVTLRAAAIFKGGYKGDRLAALGKASNGYEFGASVGKQFNSVVSVWGEVSVQSRNDNVPNATAYGIGAKFNIAPQWSAGLGINSRKYGGNLDIGGAGFTPAKFQQVREERSTFNASLGYGFASNQGVSLNFGKVTSGRNTVKDDRIVGVNYTYAFN